MLLLCALLLCADMPSTTCVKNCRASSISGGQVSKIAIELSESFVESFPQEQYIVTADFFLGKPTIIRLPWHRTFDAYHVARITADIVKELDAIRDGGVLRFYKVPQPEKDIVTFSMIDVPPGLVVFQWNTQTVCDELWVRFDVERK